MKDVSLNQNERDNIISVLEHNDITKIDVIDGIRSIWFRGENYETELRLKFLWDYKIIVSRVFLVNKRKGAFGEIIGILRAFCKRNGINEIEIESVSTEEMVRFCVKNGFSPDERSSLFHDGLILGDYTMNISGSE